MTGPRDHGGALDRAIAAHGGTRAQWLDLSTGINPRPYPLPETDIDSWVSLPDRAAHERLITAARRFWDVPQSAMILPVPGASSAIARLPALRPPAQAEIPGPTYNEHAAAFTAAGWKVSEGISTPDAKVVVHPNNPDGRIWTEQDITAPLTIIDESFCDIRPEATLIRLTKRDGVIVLKSFGKFWGLAGMRLGFAIGTANTIGPLAELLGPWPVSGPALAIGAEALEDADWPEIARKQLTADADRLDNLMRARGAELVGGTSLFRLFRVERAQDWADRLARSKILVRTFPYDPSWLRLGLPDPAGWARLEAAL